MKKILFSLTTLALLSTSLNAQDASEEKTRFGLRVSGQPTWFGSNEKSNIPSGSKFGYGFGLNIEFRLTKAASFLTGIGGDFEGGKYTFKNDKAANYEAMYWMNSSNEFVKANTSARSQRSNTAYVLKERTLKTTFISIPIMLKLSTKEMGPMKYSGLFGGEVGFRAKASANDTYLEGRKYTDSLVAGYYIVPVEDQSGLNVGKECSLIPARLIFSAGVGAEYRLSGNTAAFININYYMMLSNLLKKESEYVVYKTEPGADNSTPIKQNLKYRGIKITLGIMF
jgi:opacity protein-like surface antigen